MSSKLYVGNLPYSADDQSLRTNFAEYGDVTSAKVMMDRDSGRSKGFGFVEMGSVEQAEAAIKGLNGMSVGGRDIVVNISRPKESTGGGGYGGGDRGARGGY
jgi:RNA recognition motif-containing protein